MLSTEAMPADKGLLAGKRWRKRIATHSHKQGFLLEKGHVIVESAGRFASLPCFALPFFPFYPAICLLLFCLLCCFFSWLRFTQPS